MPATTIEAMAERLERLEGECRRWRRAGVGLALIGAVVVTLGAVRQDDGPKTIEAERFLLKDQKGTTRGEWGFMPGTNNSIFRLNNEDGVGRLMLGVFRTHSGDAESSTILLYAKDGISRLMPNVPGKGKSFMWFHDEHRHLRLELPSALTDPPPPPPEPAPAPPPADPARRTRTE